MLQTPEGGQAQAGRLGKPLDGTGDARSSSDQKSEDMGKQGADRRYNGATFRTRPKRRWRWGWHHRRQDRRRNARTLRELQKEFICISASYLPDLCNGLRNYLFRVLQSLEAGDPKHHAVKSLWDDAGNFSEPESEEDEMNME